MFANEEDFSNHAKTWFAPNFQILTITRQTALGPQEIEGPLFAELTQNSQNDIRKKRYLMENLPRSRVQFTAIQQIVE